MAEFKSSFIGGYSKKSVNEYVSKLENENDILKKALDLAEHNDLLGQLLEGCPAHRLQKPGHCRGRLSRL